MEQQSSAPSTASSEPPVSGHASRATSRRTARSAAARTNRHAARRPRKMSQAQLQRWAGETFSRGQNRGKTFDWVANNDPGYHLRCIHIHKTTGDWPYKSKTMITKYIRWFEQARGQANPNEWRSPTMRNANQVFTAGSHRGQTFRQVAREDPSYHLRCQETGYQIDGQLYDYIDYFNRYGDHNAARRGERDAIAMAIGVFF
mmetsp:Transcript_12899/g.27390  ORF Transcript_12899/g.27390 Transcript_12899/m.27390 type:complete len:202 (-) Transcript_12899:1084-1689(-)